MRLNTTENPSIGVQHIMATELDRYMQELDQSRRIPADLRQEKLELQQRLSDLKNSHWVMAKDALEVEKARLFFEIQEELDDKGKPKHSNETARNAAMVLKQKDDPDFQEALVTLRAVEVKIEKLNLAIQEVDEQIKSAAEVIWSARTLVEGATTALKAVATFDGPRLPTEIVLKAPESLPSIMLVTKGAA